MPNLKSLKLIKNLDKETFNKVSKQILVFKFNYNSILFIIKSKQFINQIINNLNYFLNNLNTNEDFEYLKTNEEIDIKEIVNEWSIYVAKVYDLDKIELPLIDDLDEDKKNELFKIIKEKNQLIKQFLFYMALKKDYPNLVNEFDWNLNLVLATDQISNLNKPLANIQFNNSNNDKICHLELNEEELDQLIEAIDKIKDELKNLL